MKCSEDASSEVPAVRPRARHGRDGSEGPLRPIVSGRCALSFEVGEIAGHSERVRTLLLEGGESSFPGNGGKRRSVQ